MNNISYRFFEDLQTKKVYDSISRPIIIADQFRTPTNMGSVIRLAGNIGALKTIFISDDKRIFRNSKINRTAAGSADKVKWEVISSVEIMNHIPDDYSIVALETTLDSTNLFTTKMPDKIALVVGNETLGISDTTLELADQKVYIPLPGIVSSLNVSHALSIGLFEWLRQMMTTNLE